MAEETVVAATSAAVAEPQITNFDGWDEDGNPVVTKKAETPKTEAADSSTADTSKETSDDAADSAAKNAQKSKRKPDVEDRFKKLNETHKAEVERLQRELEEARKPKETKETKADSSTAKTSAQKPDAPPPTRPRPTLDAKGPDGKPLYASHDAYYEDLADWKAEQRLADVQRKEAAKAQMESAAQHIKDMEAKYPDFKEKAAPLVHEISKGDCDPLAFSRLNRSAYLSDVLYTIGSNAESVKDFMAAMRTDPGKAIEVIVLMEQEIAKELGAGKAKPPAKAADDADTSSARPKPRAPAPPKEVGGRGATGEDASISAAKAGNFREFEAEQNRRLAARR